MLSAVNNISFDIGQREIVGLVGESGSGKSVTALSLMQLTRFVPGHLQTGEVRLHADGMSFDLMKYNERNLQEVRGREISMIFQEPMTSLNPALPVGEQIEEAVRKHTGLVRRAAWEKAKELIEQVGIADAEMAYRKFPHQLSGGQRQRILIAAAIASNPRLLIADEPTTALDVSVQKRIVDLLLRIQKERDMSILFISHDLDLVASFADRIMVMYAGKIIESGTIEEIFNNPRHPYTKGLIACRPPDKKRYYFLPTINDFMRISMDGSHEELTDDIAEVYRELEIDSIDYQMRKKRIYRESPILTTHALSKAYRSKRGAVAAVNDVGIKLYKGETLGIVGESGSGKTTLAKCLVGLEIADKGKVALRSDPEQRANRFQRARQIQYIFQDPYSSLNPRLTIGIQLMEPLIVHGIFDSDEERRSRVNEMLHQVGLKTYHFNKLPSEFSGGQRQRICIARALLMEPEVIICDESVSALDRSVQAQVLNLLNELKYEFDLSYIFISHDLSVVRFMSDRIMVMKEGRFVEEGEADDLFFNPKHNYTKELLSSVPKRVGAI